MKNINLNRLLILSLVIMIAGFGYANANSYSQEEANNVDDPSAQYLNEIEIDDVFCSKADPNRVFVILDHYDHIITQGKCSDVMVKFFLSISDPLLEVDNIKYYRLEYHKATILEGNLVIED